MAIMDVDDLVGKTFKMPDDNGILQPTTIIEAIKNQDNEINNSSVLTKFQVLHDNDKFEEILAHDQLLHEAEVDLVVQRLPARERSRQQALCLMQCHSLRKKKYLVN